jgi:lipopolysaccharide assembly protein A
VSQVIVFLALAFSIVIAIFAVQNTTPVAVQFLGFRADAVAVSVLVLISAALGAAAMLFFGISREVSLRWRYRSIAQQLKAAQARIAELEAAQPPPTQALAVTSAEGPPAGEETRRLAGPRNAAEEVENASESRRPRS